MALDARLDLTPEDAVRYFEAKGERLTWDYTESWRADNVHAFTVAKATSLDVLRAIRAEVARAIGDGQTFAEFKRTLRPRLEDLGWWGRQEVLDADTGELTTAQLGSVRRLRTIYQTNVQTAYMAGRYKRQRDNAGDRPYWRYVAIMDDRTRPLHAALNGRVWRWDDPIWEVIYPPNGWGCRCRVVALTESEFRALGVQLENGADAVVELQVPIGRDGETVTVQGVRYRDELGREKVFRPDPGWDYNPGAEWAHFDPAGFRGEPLAVSPAVAGELRAAAELPAWRDLGRPDLATASLPRLADAGFVMPASSQAAADAMVRAALLGGQALREVVTPVDVVGITAELLPRVPPGAERLAPYVLPTLQQPLEVWLTPYDDGTYRLRYLALLAGVDGLLMQVRVNRDGTLAWQTFELAAADLLRVGTLLYGWEPGQ